MGHSSIIVSLTYLRGLEIAELKEDRYAYNIKPLQLSFKCFTKYGRL